MWNTNRTTEGEGKEIYWGKLDSRTLAVYKGRVRWEGEGEEKGGERGEWGRKEFTVFQVFYYMHSVTFVGVFLSIQLLMSISLCILAHCVCSQGWPWTAPPPAWRITGRSHQGQFLLSWKPNTELPAWWEGKLPTHGHPSLHFWIYITNTFKDELEVPKTPISYHPSLLRSLKARRRDKKAIRKRKPRDRCNS